MAKSISREIPEAAVDPQPLPPEEVSRMLPGYEVLSLVGNGEMGAVYLAMQTRLDRPAALELLPLFYSDQSGSTEQFTQVAKAMARLHHPGIASVYDFGRTAEGHLYLVMEFVDGTNLVEGVAHRNFPVHEALVLAGEVCAALAFAHENGVLHHDLRPEHVLREKDGRARILNFGLAKLRYSHASRHSAPGLAMATPGYMAPELLNGLPADHRADVFSAGALLYAMLCGEAPRGPDPLSKLSRCSRRVNHLVRKALQADPAHRFQTANEMQSALHKAVRSRGWEALGRGPLWRWALPVAAAVVMLAALVFWWQHRPLRTKAVPPVEPTVAKPSEGGLIAASQAQPFTNSLGLQFVPVPITGGPTAGQQVLFCTCETRVMDFEQFATDSHLPMVAGHFYRKPSRPIELVSWDEANAFAHWLTERERKRGLLPRRYAYRLPSDYEWSCAVGLGQLEDPKATPAAKKGLRPEIFPWGRSWPPPQEVGNFASVELGAHSGKNPIIEGYYDSYDYTAPVRSYPPNALGIYDLEGNVMEWCQDESDPAKPGHRVMRGGSFYSSSALELCSSARHSTAPDRRQDNLGFRVVLAPEADP